MKYFIGISLVCLVVTGGCLFGASSSHSFSLSHTVAVVSSVAFTGSSSIVTAKVNKLGDATISNNTMDGWSLTVLSANSGKFMNTSTGNGEVPIDYELEIQEISGTLGDGMNLESSIDLGVSASSIAGVVTNQNSPTESLKLGFLVDFSAQATRFDMAGTYSDVLTITYADL